MKIQLLAIVFVMFSLSATFGQTVEVIKYPQLKEMMDTDKSSDIVIYNFWATWCAPCIKEMPYFEKMNSHDNVKVKFISFDDSGKLNERVIPFIKKKDIQSEVYLLDETDFNKIIDQIDPRWSGAIPATIIMNHKTNEKLFFEQEFREGELEKVVLNQI